MLEKHDKLSALSMLTGLWAMTIVAWLSYSRVRPGSGEDAHHDVHNQLGVCNLPMPRMYNKSSEIECYLSERVTRQTRTLWKNCDATLYHVLHALEVERLLSAASKPRPVNCVVIIEPIGTERRTTCWARQQDERLQRKLKKALNQWNRVLAKAHPTDFFGGSIDVRIVCVVEPVKETMQVYNGIVDDDGSLMARYSTFKANTLSADPTWEQLKEAGVTLSIVFQGTERNAYGHVASMPTQQIHIDGDRFVLQRCFPRGPTIFINDTVSGTLPSVGTLDMFVSYALLTFTAYIVIALQVSDTPNMQSVINVLVAACAAVCTGAVLTVALRPVTAPACPGQLVSQPTRFASDSFPVSLLTHELGHALLVTDHYQSLRLKKDEISNFMPGPVRPLKCGVNPVSVMGAENHITPLDSKYVVAMWQLLKPNGTPYSAAHVPANVQHEASVQTEINKLQSREANECHDGKADDGKRNCVTNDEALQLIRTSLPDSVQGKAVVKRVSLSFIRGFVQQSIFSFATLIDLAICTTFTVAFVLLWATPNQNGHNTDGKDFRRMVPTWSVPLLWGWIAFTIWRTHAIEQCIDLDQSWASIASKISWALIVPLCFITYRRVRRLLL